MSILKIVFWVEGSGFRCLGLSIYKMSWIHRTSHGRARGFFSLDIHEQLSEAEISERTLSLSQYTCSSCSFSFITLYFYLYCLLGDQPWHHVFYCLLSIITRCEDETYGGLCVLCGGLLLWQSSLFFTTRPETLMFLTSFICNCSCISNLLWQKIIH